jgi:hypothetical protein
MIEACLREYDPSALSQINVATVDVSKSSIVLLVEEEMAATDSALKPISGAGWAQSPTAFPPHAMEQAAQASLQALDIIESWLTASRQMMDLWRLAVREAQDGMLAAYRQQIVDAYAHDLLEEMKIPGHAQTGPGGAVSKADMAHAA